MALSDLGPNWAIIKQPWNWFVIAFALITLTLLFDFLQLRKE